MIELQEILRQYGQSFLEAFKLSYEQMKAYSAILNCRTSILGGHVDVCDHCGHEQHSYNSVM